MSALIRVKAFRRFSLLAAIFGLIGLVGCDLLGTSGNATMRVLLTDAPFPYDLVNSANVTIERVELVSENEGVFNVTESWSEPQSFNLLDLRDGVTALLGEIEIPDGTYEQIRLIVGDEASVIMKEDAGGDVYDLRIPSGTQTGIKVPLESLHVESESYITLTLDFLVDSSFVALGDPNSPSGVTGFNFKPVVKLLTIDVDGISESDTEGEEDQ